MLQCEPPGLGHCEIDVKIPRDATVDLYDDYEYELMNGSSSGLGDSRVCMAVLGI